MCPQTWPEPKSGDFGLNWGRILPCLELVVLYSIKLLYNQTCNKSVGRRKKRKRQINRFSVSCKGVWRKTDGKGWCCHAAPLRTPPFIPSLMMEWIYVFGSKSSKFQWLGQYVVEFYCYCSASTFPAILHPVMATGWKNAPLENDDSCNEQFDCSHTLQQRIQT